MGPVVSDFTGLFGALQLCLAHPDKHHMKITQHLWDHLNDFEAFASNISQQPTCLAEVVLDYPLLIGSVDAAKLGMGGILFALGYPATLWWTTSPANIQQCITSMDNPMGDLTKQ